MEIDARATWTSDGFRSTAFDDVYYTPFKGLEESRYVFLRGNGIPEVWLGRTNHRIGELGFGTGLNWFAVRHELERIDRERRPYVTYFSVEKYPLDRDQIARGATLWSELSASVDELLAVYEPSEGLHRWRFESCELVLLVGDVLELDRAMSGIECWFFDGFSPAKNPAMWSADVFRRVARASVKNATFATFTSAGSVKTALRGAGFFVRRRPGFGQKRHMCVGHLVDSPPDTSFPLY